MSTGSRPGGLTALAVFNLVGGVFDLIGVASNTFILLVHRGTIEVPDEEAKKGILTTIDLMGEQAVATQIPWCAVCGLLLILSGIGYLKCKRVLGRGFGNAYALVSMGFAGVFTWFLSQHTGLGFGFGVLILVIYPVLTLILVNTTFKEDFTR